MSNIRDLLAKNMARRMKALNLGITEVARRSKITRQTLDKYANAKISAGIDAIEALAEALETNASWLLTDHDQAPPKFKKRQPESYTQAEFMLKLLPFLPALDETEMELVLRYVANLKAAKSPRRSGASNE